MTRGMELTSLLGSRICHDLISPLGAIGNGVELLAMSGLAKGPEMSLISESVENANARIRFFRVAFGAAAPGQGLGRGEIVEILAGMAKGGRLAINWQVDGEVQRREAKLAFLCLQCLEAALPWGGRIVVNRRDGVWTLNAEAAKIRDLTEQWETFDRPDSLQALQASNLEFALAPLWAVEIGLRIWREASEGRIGIGFAPR